MRTSAPIIPDPYASSQALWGWPVGRGKDGELWPVHCYGMVGVGRNLSPDTGSGAEPSAVIGHAPRPPRRTIPLIGPDKSRTEHPTRPPPATGPIISSAHPAPPLPSPLAGPASLIPPLTPHDNPYLSPQHTR